MLRQANLKGERMLSEQSLVIMFLIVWYLSGVVSFVYWWTRDWRMDSWAYKFMWIIGITGLGAFLFGWIQHGGKK